MATYIYTPSYATIYPNIPLTASPTGGAGGTPTVWDWASPPTDGRWAVTALPVNDTADNGGPGNPGPPVVIVGSAGESIISGHGAPPTWAGHDGDYWMDVDATVLYGPRVTGSWPATGTSLVAGGALPTTGGTLTGPLTVPSLNVTGALTRAGVTDVYNVRAYGATGDGVTDDRAAIEAAIDAATSTTQKSGVVFLPPGTYRIGSPLTPTAAVRVTGSYAATIKSTGSAIFNFANAYMHPGYQGQTGIVEIDHLTLDATGGHVFDSPNINQGSFHDLVIYQRSADKSVWNQTTGSLLWVQFSNIISNTYGATRSVPGWLISGSSTADVANLTWDHCLFQNPDQDATQYQVVLQATGGTSGRYYTEQIAFRDCYFEQPFGGVVKSLSGQGTVFDNCRVYDVYTKPVGNSMFYIGQAPNSTWPSTNTTFAGCGRDLQGPDGSTTWDIQLEPTSLQTEISQYDVRDIPGTFTGHPYLNLGNSGGVVLSNNRAQTLTNAGGTGLWNFPSDGTVAGSLVPQTALPSDQGYVAWTYDVVAATGSTAPALGSIVLVRIVLRQPQPVFRVVLYVNTGGGTLTAGQNVAGLYDSNGTLIDTTADQTTAWGNAGLKPMSLLGGTRTLAAGAYYVAFVSNGTTTPAFARGTTLNNALINGNVGVATSRFVTNGTGTALPASLTLASSTQSNVSYWAALQ